jgi:hypothetical protein
MPTAPVSYFRLAEGKPLPDLLPYAPYRAVLVLDAEHGQEWQKEVSEWLVRSGCLYMMAWGVRCSTWDDSVDWANIDRFEGRDIPDERFVLTTWHDDETLDEVFWYADFCARHPEVELRHTIILHVSRHEDGEAMLARFRAAQDAL